MSFIPSAVICAGTVFLLLAAVIVARWIHSRNG